MKYETEIRDAIAATWQYVAADVDTVEGWGDTLDEIVEVTTDANRVESYGGLSPEAKVEWVALSWEEKDEIARAVLRGYEGGGR